MKKLFFAVSALAALSLLAPSAGLAQLAQNHIGLYADEGATSVNLTGVDGNTQQTIYVYITNPYNTNLDQPMSNIKAAEWGLVAPANVFVLDLAFPVSNVNVGDFINVLVGYGVPIGVSDGIAKLGTYTVLYLGGPALFYLTPAVPASITDMLAVQDNSDEQLYACYPSSSVFADPVFGINTEPGVVATDDATFDSLKALYR